MRILFSEPYSVREARIHIRRLRDLLSTSLYQSSFSATDNLSLSLCTTIAGVDPEGECGENLFNCMLLSLIHDVLEENHFYLKALHPVSEMLIFMKFERQGDWFAETVLP